MRLLGIILALLAVAACTYVEQNNPLASEALSVEKERELTADVARQIRAQLPLVNDPVLLAYLNELGQEIVATTEPQPFLYRFTIIDDEALNAFTIGGGYVYIHSGVIAAAGDVAELQGVIAHEVAHVRERHIAKRGEDQGVSTLITLVTLAAVALGGGDPSLIALGQGVNVALQLQNSRSAEAEADREGIQYMVRARYDPAGMQRFFRRLLAEYPNPTEIPAYLFTHPAVKDRVDAVRVEMDRTDAPRDLRRYDPRLDEMQARLARLQNPVAGGSGLLARPEFDRSKTDPLMQEAREEREAGHDERAHALLAQAEEAEPNDPRVPLMRATWAEEQDDWETAQLFLERAFALDPYAPLVEYRLGVANARLGKRTRAAFYLEQAAAGYRPGTAGRRRAEAELRRLISPVVDESGLRGRALAGSEPRFRGGASITWWGRLSEGFMGLNPRLRVRWIGPDREVAHEETVMMGPRGGVSSRLDGDDATPGTWLVEVTTDDTPVDRRRFEIVDPYGSRN